MLVFKKDLLVRELLEFQSLKHFKQTQEKQKLGARLIQGTTWGPGQGQDENS